MNQLVDADGAPIRGPRPLRSPEHLWGVLILTKAERKQIVIGNALLRPMIQFFAAASKSILTMVIMEHPKRTWLPSAPSSWLSPELTWVQDLPNALSIETLTSVCSKRLLRNPRLYSALTVRIYVRLSEQLQMALSATTLRMHLF